MLATTPSGSCEMRSSRFCLTSAKTFSSRSTPAASARKKSRRGNRPLSSLLDWRIGLPTSRVSVRASVSCIATIRSRKARMASSRFLSGSRRPVAAARRVRARISRAPRRCGLPSISAIGLAGRRIDDFHRVLSINAWRARGSHRGCGVSSMQDSRRPDRGTPDAIARRTRTKVPIQRSASTRRSGSDHASTTRS